MVDVKKFIESFLQIEANQETTKRIPDLQNANDAIDQYNSCIIDILKLEVLNELEDEDYYERFEGKLAKRPRHLFKISQYTHAKYGDVYVAFTSQSNPRKTSKYLSDTIFIINEEGSLKVARRDVYTSYSSDGKSYSWEKVEGYTDLTFESLEGPVAIERYQEPLEDFDGLKHYNDNI